jgi:hypothetical protein
MNEEESVMVDDGSGVGPVRGEAMTGYVVVAAWGDGLVSTMAAVPHNRVVVHGTVATMSSGYRWVGGRRWEVARLCARHRGRDRRGGRRGMQDHALTSMARPVAHRVLTRPD